MLRPRRDRRRSQSAPGAAVHEPPCLFLLCCRRHKIASPSAWLMLIHHAQIENEIIWPSKALMIIIIIGSISSIPHISVTLTSPGKSARMVSCVLLPLLLDFFESGLPFVSSPHFLGALSLPRADSCASDASGIVWRDANSSAPPLDELPPPAKPSDGYRHLRQVYHGRWPMAWPGLAWPGFLQPCMAYARLCHWRSYPVQPLGPSRSLEHR